MDGTALSATPAALLFNFSAGGSQYALFQSPYIGSDRDFFCVETQGCTGSVGSRETVDVASSFPGQTVPVTGVIALATAASTAVPEPASLALLGLPLGLLGLVGMPRRQGAAAA